jgi:hypothetical protein
LRRLFYATLLAGVTLTVLAAGVFPLPQHQRYRSSIHVLANGGRQEDFTIEWPRDRIQVMAPDSGGLLLNAGGGAVLSPAGGPGASTEAFRLRDDAGNIIGLASRTTTAIPGRDGRAVQATDWMLLIPSRGALLLSQLNSRDVAPRTRPAAGDIAPAADVQAFWSEGSRYRITAGPEAEGMGTVVRGTEEFAGLRGSYEETWELAEVAADGSTRGRIMLSTRTIAAR